jgi:hypothetical protein
MRNIDVIIAFVFGVFVADSVLYPFMGGMMRHAYDINILLVFAVVCLTVYLEGLGFERGEKL